MAYTETVLQTCNSITEEQANELREFLVEACQQLHADPELLAMGLKRLEEAVTDQGYEWGNLVGTMLQLSESSLTIESARKLKAAWNDSVASNATIADIAALLNRDFPVVNDFFRNLVTEALEDHDALSGLAGGTHIGQGIATASSKTGKALASPWNKNSKLNKKQRIIGEAAEVVIAAGATFLVGRAVGRSIYAAGEKRQLWGPINTKIGGKAGPSMKDLISGDLPGDGQGPLFRVPTEDREQVLAEIIQARNALIDKSGPLSRDEAAHLYENAKSILVPADGGNDGVSGRLINTIESSLHYDPLHRQFATALEQHLASNPLPERLRKPLEDIDKELTSRGIRVNAFQSDKLNDYYNADGLKPQVEPPYSDFIHAEHRLEETKVTFDNAAKDVAYIDESHPSWYRHIEYLRTTQIKLQLLDYADKTNRSIGQIVADYSNSISQDDIENADKQLQYMSEWHQAALNGRKLDDGIPLSPEEKTFFDVARNMDWSITFGDNPDFEEMKKFVNDVDGKLDDPDLGIHLPESSESTAKLLEQPNFLNDHFKQSRLGHDVKIGSTDDVRLIRRENYMSLFQFHHVDSSKDYERDLRPENQEVGNWVFGKSSSGFPFKQLKGPITMKKDFREELLQSDLNQTGLNFFTVQHKGPKADWDGTTLPSGRERIQKIFASEGDHAQTAQEFYERFKDDYHDLKIVDGVEGRDFRGELVSGEPAQIGYSKAVFNKDGFLQRPNEIKVKKKFTGRGILKSSSHVDDQELAGSNTIGNREASAAKYQKALRWQFMDEKIDGVVTRRDHFIKNDPTVARAEQIQVDFHSFLRNFDPRRVAARATRDQDALLAQRTTPSEGQRQEALVGDQPRIPLNDQADQVAGIDTIAGREMRRLDAEAVDSTDRFLKDTEAETAEGINSVESDAI